MKLESLSGHSLINIDMPPFNENGIGNIISITN
jgi:hypothetical protein